MTESATGRLALPLLQPGQAQKEMSHNEALVRLDLAAQATVSAAGMTDPPAEPGLGEAWILGESATGEWAGHDGEIAGWTAGGWRFLAPFEGMRAWVSGSGGFALFAEGEWRLGELYGRLIVDGVQVVGPQAAAIADPAGGTMVDGEARAALSALLAAMRDHGLIESP